MLRFYNTLGRKLEEFAPLEQGKVRMYTCGPTVYDYPHLGNFRTFVFEDVLRRYLKFKGYDVVQVMNLTDVDDKTIRGSRGKGVRLRDYTDIYVKAFFDDLDTLRLERAEYYPRATDHVEDMLSLIRRLLDKSYAYERRGSVYFDISKFPEYGCLSGAKASSEHHQGVEEDEYYGKDEARDFALWKAWDEDDGDVFWDTSLGRGRPGWHVECSAMSMKYLGETFDIHAGGVDLIFPHHENEIAQSEASTGNRFVRYWLHSEHLTVEGRRMAKSLGNYYTPRELVNKGYDPVAIRYLLMSAHYRDKLNFTFQALDQAANTVSKLNEFYARVVEAKGSEHQSPRIQQLSQALLKRFEEAMDLDLNLPAALAALFDFVRNVNREIDAGMFSQEGAAMVVDALMKVNRVLGVFEAKAPPGIDKEVLMLIEKREEARKRKDWATADQIRTRLLERGIVLEDTPGGVRWKVKR